MTNGDVPAHVEDVASVVQGPAKVNDAELQGTVARPHDITVRVWPVPHAQQEVEARCVIRGGQQAGVDPRHWSLLCSRTTPLAEALDEGVEGVEEECSQETPGLRVQIMAAGE